MRLRGQLNPGEYVIVATRQHPGALLPGLTCLLLGIAAAAFAVWYLGWSPIYILIAAAAIGISWTLLITKKAKK